MGLYKRGPTWWISFSCNGRQVRHSTETGDKKIAEKIYHKVMNEVAEGKWFDKRQGTQTFAEMMDRYMEEHSVPDKRSTSRDEASLKHLLPFFGSFTLRRICRSDIGQYKILRRKEGAAAATLNRELALMKHAFTLAVKEWEWILENPLKMVPMAKEPPPPDRWLDDKEEGRLLTACPEWLRDIVFFAVDTGCRRGEILSLQWNNLDFRRGVAVVFGKKTAEWRSVPLTRRLLDILTMRRTCRKVQSLHENPVFCNSVGQPVNIHELRWAFETALDKAAISNFRFHDLRHTFATRLAQNGVDLFTIQKLLGHKSFATTERYAHHCTESLRKGINVLDDCTDRLCDNGFESKEQETLPDVFITNLSQSAKNTLDFLGVKS